MTLQNTLDTIAPLGHTIIAVSAPPATGTDTAAWIDHLTSVSDAINQKPAILVIPFTDIVEAEN
ncbi:phage tail protein, partial [Acinetobacter pittii]|nr:phage tail protein [Acinetobacter pittii]